MGAIERMGMVCQEDGGANRIGTNGSAGKSDALESRVTNSLAVRTIDPFERQSMRRGVPVRIGRKKGPDRIAGAIISRGERTG